MDNPFELASKPLWRRLWKTGSSPYTPPGWARAAGLVGPVAAFLLPSPGLPIAVAVFAGPPLLVDWWFKSRHRARQRREERILPLC